MEANITVKNIRPLFFNEKNGMPHKNYLVTTKEVMTKYIPNLKDYSGLEKRALNSIMNSVLSCVRKSCRINGLNWIDPIIDGKIHHGFSQDPDHIQNSLNRCEKRKNGYLVSYKEQKKLAAQQLQLSMFG